jgi:diguanylate cyclase (GGDEF)-like protein
LWFDLDHFKDINDSLGHAAGDELLSAFGQHLQDETRAYSTVARLGGDEFGMLIPHALGPEAVSTAARLIESLSSRTFLAGDHDLRISASVGVVLYPDHGDEPSKLLARADIAMYDAKARGGNQVVPYVRDDTWQTAMTERLEAAERILSAMREDRLVLYGQPIVGPTDGDTKTFELLIRMRGEDGSLVLPAEIIPTAERLGLIRDIDRWVARRAIRLLALAQGQNQDVQFSINLSGCAFSDNTLLDVIRDEFEATCASPERLIIEITETTTIANMEGARRFISALREIGCRFSIDDFGSAASSFYYLKHLPVDFLKIDGSLVTGLAADSSDAHFVHAIVEMCHGLKIQTVAEYVETEKVLDAISAAGVDFVQGYHLGRPEPLDSYLGDEFAEAARTLDAMPPMAQPSRTTR